jgi:hypothetical protein
MNRYNAVNNANVNNVVQFDAECTECANDWVRDNLSNEKEWTIYLDEDNVHNA